MYETKTGRNSTKYTNYPIFWTFTLITKNRPELIISPKSWTFI